MKHAISIDWASVHTVFLDLDGTLLDLHFDNHFWLEHLPRCYAEQHAIPLPQARETLQQLSTSTAGSLNWYCLDHWSTETALDIVAHKHEVAHKIALRENVVPFLQRLRALKKYVVLLTNAHRKSIQLKFQYLELQGYFDEIISSHDLALAKEEAGFWQALAKQHPFDKNHSLFIDDNLAVLDNARAYGIAQLLSIRQPDSQIDPRSHANYPLIDDFLHLFD